MQSTSLQQPNSFDMGVMSMVSLLTNISKSSQEGTAFLGKMYDSLLNIEASLDGKDSKDKSFLGKFFDTSILNVVKNVDIFNSRNRKILIEIRDGISLLSEGFRNSASGLTPDSPTGTGKNYLQRLDDNVYSIYKYLTTKERTTKSKDRAPARSSKDGIYALMGFNEAIQELRANMDIQLLKKLDRFNESFTALVDKDPVKIKALTGFISGLCVDLRTLAERGKDAAIGILALTGAFALMSLVTSINVFSIIRGITIFSAVIIGFLAVMKVIPYSSVFKFVILMYGMSSAIEKFGIAIAIFTVSMMLLSFVSWDSVFKMVTFMTLFGATIRLMEGGTGGAKGFFNFKLIFIALGFTLLASSLKEFGTIPIGALAKVIGFIAALGVVIAGFNALNRGGSIITLNRTGPASRGGSKMPSGMIGFSFGLMMMALAIYALEDIQYLVVYRLVGFIGAMGIVLAIFNRLNRVGSAIPTTQMGGGKMPSGMIGFAFGLGVMVLAMYAMAELPWEAMGKTLVFIIALHTILLIFNKLSGRRVGNVPGGLPSFAFGLGIMVLAMYAMDELPWSAMFKTLTFLTGLGLVLKLYNSKTNVSFLSLSASLLIMGWALNVFKRIDLTINDILVLGSVLGTLAAAHYLIGKNALGIAKGAIAMGIMSVSLIAISLSLFIIDKINVNPNTIFSFMMGVGILALGFSIISSLITSAVAGALGFIPVAIASLAGALTLWAINNVNVDYLKILNFMGSVAILGAGFALFSLLSVPAVIGAAAFIVVAVAALLGAASLYAIADTPVNNKNIDNFMSGVNSLAYGFAKNVGNFALGLIGAIAFIPIGIAAALAAGSLLIISKITLDKTKLDTFNYGVKSIVDTISGFGIIQLGKASIKALALLPVFATAYLAILTLRKISETTIDRKKVFAFGEVISEFTKSIVDTLAANETNLRKANPGIVALGRLMNISKGIADTIKMMANMEYYEHKVVNGKLVLSKVRKLSPNDFKQVGINLATMLKCLIDPLVVLGSNSNAFVIGGMTIQNPFKSDNVLKGIELMGMIGNAFKPLVESISTYAKLAIVSNPAELTKFTNSLINIIGTFMWAFNKLGTLDMTLVSQSITTITRFVDSFKKLKNDELSEITNVLEKFVHTLSDDAKWRRITRNMAVLKKQFSDIAGSINKIDIEKATLFNNTLQAFAGKDTTENINEVVEQLKEIFGLISTGQKEQQTQFSSFIPQATGFNFATNPVAKKQEVKKSEEDQSSLQMLLTEAVRILTDVASKLGGVNDKLTKPLKVQIAGGNPNQI